MKSPEAPPSILVVDDTVENLRLLSRLLSVHGYEIRPVTNGRAALQAVDHDPPDAILLDLNMPDMNGYEVCEALKQREHLRDIPVIFLTAMVGTQDKVKAFEVGGVDYITKPFQVEEVLARVRTHVALRRARTELADSYARLRAMSALRDDLFHMIVHDMRSPLTVLVGSLEVLRLEVAEALGCDPDRLSGGVADEWRAAMRSTQLLACMANNLLDVSRLEAGMMPVERAPHDLVPIAESVRADLVNLERERPLELVASGALTASCDVGLVRRVIENLVNNAIKHSPPRGRVRIVLTHAAPVTARVAVHDEGPGVPPEAREAIFDKYRSLGTRRQAYHSAGLGLAFCRLAVEAHGGAIGVDSSDKGGSVFWFELPTEAQASSAASSAS